MSVVFALATPPAKSAIGILRITGDGCFELVNGCLGFGVCKAGRFYLKDLVYKEEFIDRVGLICFKGPKSYTGEDSLEIHFHGGLAIISKLVGVMRQIGLDEASPGEFTKRAFLNNKLSLNEAEAVADLIDLTDERGVSLLSSTVMGSLTSSVCEFAVAIDKIRMRVEGEIDFNDEDEDFINKDLHKDLEFLLDGFKNFADSCINIKKGTGKNKVLFVGPVNSGKSSLFNLLVGYDRAIVSHSPGTTRDIIESEVFFNSNVFSVFDSAGIRDASEEIEKKGIELSFEEIKKADLVVGVFERKDLDRVSFFEDLVGSGCFVKIQNKIDVDDIDSNNFDCCVSAKTGEGLKNFKNLISSRVESDVYKKGLHYMVRDRHENLFNETLVCLEKGLINIKKQDTFELAAEDLKLARSCLDQLVGKKYSDSLLGDIFSSFCIGK